MVTGRVPFDGTTPSAVMHKHLKEPLIPPDHLNKSLSAGVGEIIEVMMAKNPEDRYPSMAELIADLQAVLGGEPPFQARKKYDHNLLSDLATGGKVIVPTNALDDTAPSSPKISVQWVLVLAVISAISLLFNLVQLLQ
jgi:serine/threonine-protein kinase